MRISVLNRKLRKAFGGRVTAALAEISPALGTSNPLGPHVRCIPAPDSYRAGSPAQAETQFLAALRAASDEAVRQIVAWVNGLQ